jgi:hypothetical protein
MKKLAVLLILVFLLFPYTTQAQKGDIAVWLVDKVSMDHPYYQGQQDILSLEYKAMMLGLYEPYGNPQSMCDDTHVAMHIEILTNDEEPNSYGCNVPYTVVTFSLPNANPEMLAYIYETIWEYADYGLPLKGLDALWEGRSSYEDYCPMINQTRMQSAWEYSHVCDNFWNRYYNCATATAWAIIAEEYIRTNNDGIIGVIESLYLSIDTITPGILGAMLEALDIIRNAPEKSASENLVYSEEKNEQYKF